MSRNFTLPTDPATGVLSASQNYTNYKITQWLHRALVAGAEGNSAYFQCLSYAQNGLHDIVQALGNLLQEHEAQKTVQLYTHERHKLCERLQGVHKVRHASLLGDIWDEEHDLRWSFHEIIAHSYLLGKKVPMPREKQRIRNHITSFLGCSSDMLDFLEFMHAILHIPQMEKYFHHAISIYRKDALPVLAKVLHIPNESLRKIVLEAERCDFIDDAFHNCSALTPLMNSLWNAEDKSSMEDLLYVQFKGKALALERYHLPVDTIAHVKRLMASKTDEPMHILLYGAPGTGKTSFAHSLAAELGVKAWGVASLMNNSEQHRRASLIACTHVAAKNEGAFVVVEEAERLLDTAFTGMHQTKDKAWLNAFLEHKGRRIVWITNHIRHIDDAVRRRFAFSIHFDDLTTEQRHYAWEQVIKDARVVSRMTQDEIKYLVRQYPVAVAVVAKAVRHAKLMKERKGAFAKTVERILEAHITLERGGQKQQKMVTDNEGYTLDGVTLEQGRAHDMGNIMKKIHKIDAIHKDGTLPKAGGSMLFYGPPGTGKSALAHYMAQQLGRECVVKKASDLLSMYVGEAEKNIAEAFEHAEARGNVLVIDEADSFLYSRESATRSWEMTQVNEFLTQLENYRGICICTSNRRTAIDAAAMRRFSFKIAFSYAGAVQVEKLYNAILAPLSQEKLTENQKRTLLSCKSLAPGDFAAVRSQFWLEDDTSHAKLIEALVREQKDKLDTAGKVMGFKSLCK